MVTLVDFMKTDIFTHAEIGFFKETFIKLKSERLCKNGS